MANVEVGDAWARVDSALGLVADTKYRLYFAVPMYLQVGTATPQNMNNAVLYPSSARGGPGTATVPYQHKTGKNLYARAIGPYMTGRLVAHSAESLEPY